MRAPAPSRRRPTSRGGLRACRPAAQRGLLAFAATLLILATGPGGPPLQARIVQPEPSLQTVLARAADYTAGYFETLTSFVAEERYVQRTSLSRPGQPRLPGASEADGSRLLRSDFVIVPGLGAGSPWLGVREVLEVDGKAVDGEHGRIEALLKDGAAGTAARLRALADAQARFNLGALYRTINVPTLPLEFLLRERQDRLRFKRLDDAVMHGARVWRVTFRERVRPTLIRTPEGRDVLSEGVFWIAPDTGAVVRTELRGAERPRGLTWLILVSYAHHDRFRMLLPDDMHEQYQTGRSRIEGHATYSRFRRFETDVRIR